MNETDSLKWGVIFFDAVGKACPHMMYAPNATVALEAATSAHRLCGGEAGANSLTRVEIHPKSYWDKIPHNYRWNKRQ